MTARTAQLLLERIAQLEAALLDAQTIAENHHTRALAAEAEVRALREVARAADKAERVWRGLPGTRAMTEAGRAVERELCRAVNDLRALNAGRGRP